MVGVALGLIVAAGLGYWLGLRRLASAGKTPMPAGAVAAYFAGIAAFLG